MSHPEPFPTNLCGAVPSTTQEIEHSPPTNVVTLGDGGHFRWNGGIVRVAMSQKRIRIGCTEVSVEAAREIMQQHGLRFGKPPEEVWQEVQ